MNNFSVLVKKRNEYKIVNGNAVFPLDFAYLLDEQLDEAHLVIRNSNVSIFEPLTEFKIELKKDNTITKELFMVLAQDKPREFPVGSGFYVHDLYLIEQTKLLEGIYCQSITFTNVLKRDYTTYQYSALSYFNFDAKGFLNNDYDGYVRKALEQEYSTPLQNDSILTIKKPKELAEKILSVLYLNNTTNTQISLLLDECSASYNSFGIEKQLSYKEDVSVNLDVNLVIKYKITLVESQTISTGVQTSTIAKQSHFDIYYNISGVENKYPLRPWTIKSVINRVLDLAEPIFDGEKPRYELNPAQTDKFDKIQAPEFTMTQCTLREQLKIIGGYIHAEPRLGGYDADGNYQENWIFFDEYGTGEKSSIANAPYVYKGNSTDISQYCTDIQTNASNIVNSLNYAQGVIIDPDSTNTQTLRTDSINVKLTDSTSKVATQLPIYKITKVECGLYDDDGNWLYEPKDITSYVFEAHEYHSTLSSYEGTYPYAKCYAIYYTQGQKGLDGLFFKPDNAVDSMWENYAISNILASVNDIDATEINSKVESYFPTLAFRVSYLPIYDAKFSHNKQLIIPTNKRFSQIYNQSENLIETSYYGENIKGVAQRLGNVEQTRTYMLSDISQIPKAGQVLDGYVISAVTTEIMPFYIKCTVALSKDFNRISQYVGINSNKRISEVSERQAYKRDILLKDYVVFTDDADKYFYTDIDGVKKQKKPSIAFNNYDAIKGCFVPTSIKPVTACVGEGLNYKCDLINNTRIKLPVISSSFGNSILFSWQYKDNYSAGERVISDKNNAVNEIVPYWQTDVPYCDYYGRIYKYKFSLFNNTDYLNNDNMYRYIEVHIDEILTGLGQEITDNNREDTLKTYHNIIFSEERDITQEAQYQGLIKTFSKAMFDQAKTVAFDLDGVLATNICTQTPYCVCKDSREALSFNYEVEMVTDQDDIIIGSALASNNPLVNNKNQDALIYFFDEPINKFAKEIDISKAINQEGWTTAHRGENDIVISLINEDFKSYAVVTPVTTETDTYEDEQGNVSKIEIQYGGELILARNKPKSAYNGATGDTIYFIATSNPYNE